MSSLQLLRQSMQNMSKLSNLLCLAAVSIAVVSCGGSDKKSDSASSKATVEGQISAAPSSEIILEKCGVGQSVILDVVTTDQEGNFEYEFDVMKGDPQLISVHNGADVFAMLLLEAGDDVSFQVDKDGNVAVDGSDESAKLNQLEKEYHDVLTLVADLVNSVDSTSSRKYQAQVQKQISEEYVKYNRQSVKYIMANMKSLTVIPVLYRSIGDAPLFARTSDAIMFSSVADSLLTVYPESELVRELRADADRMISGMELAEMVKNTEPIGYYDIELSGLDGKKKKLSDLDSKVILLYFWTASQPGQNIFNVDVLKPLYEKYHEKGFDIYQVSLDADKVMWATTVMGQELPWTNVCDTKGFASQYASLYNLQVLPSSFVISDGELIDGGAVDADSFETLLKKLLK